MDFILRVAGDTGEFAAGEEQGQTWVSEGDAWDVGKGSTGGQCWGVDERGWYLSWERALGVEGWGNGFEGH